MMALVCRAAYRRQSAKRYDSRPIRVFRAVSSYEGILSAIAPSPPSQLPVPETARHVIVDEAARSGQRARSVTEFRAPVVRMRDRGVAPSLPPGMRSHMQLEGYVGSTESDNQVHDFEDDVFVSLSTLTR